MNEFNGTMETQDALDKLRAMAAEDEDKQTGAEQPPVQDNPPGEPESFIRRVRGGKLTGEDIPEDIRADWVRCILGGKPFTYSVPVLNGKVLFVFGELGSEEAKFYRRMSESLPGSVETQVKLSILMYLKRLEGSVEIEQTTGKDLMGNDRIDRTPSQKIDQAYDALCDSLPQGLIRFLIGAWGIYSTLVGILTDDSFPDSF